MADGAIGARLVAFSTALAITLGLLWLAAWVLNVTLGPFSPILTAVVVAVVILLVLRRPDD